jgi:hypothetical protein
MDIVNYRGWPNCCRLTNGLIELIATTAVGPRIIHFGFVGGANELHEIAQDAGQMGGDRHRFYGGHRLWHAPEEKPRTYWPDNVPVHYELLEQGVRLIQAVEGTTGIQKEIEIRLDPQAAHVELVHRLRNTNLWAIELAPWALTMMAPGGTAIIPLPPRGTHTANLLPTSQLVLWAYTDLSDARWTWGQKYILLRQDAAARTPQKIGVTVPDGWLAYARAGHLFVKRFAPQPGATYPDMGCSAESFTDADMLEVETLGPQQIIQPGTAIEHRETWQLYRDVAVPSSDADVESGVLLKIRGG